MRPNRKALTATCLLVLCLPVSLLAQQMPRLSVQPQPVRVEADRIPDLIKQLGDRSFAKREAASKQLDAIGEPTLPALLEAAARANDLEVRRRAERLLDAYSARATRKEAEKLQGTWALVSHEMDGERTSWKDRAIVFTVKDELWSLTRGGGAPFQGGTIAHIEKLEKFNAIDLVIRRDDKCDTAHAIYAIEGGTLRYLTCGSRRAKEFTTRPGDRRRLMTFRRTGIDGTSRSRLRSADAGVSMVHFQAEERHPCRIGRLITCGHEVHPPAVSLPQPKPSLGRGGRDSAGLTGSMVISTHNFDINRLPIRFTDLISGKAWRVPEK